MTTQLVTADRYATITGDSTTTALAAAAALADAQELLEDKLERALPQAERTETLRPIRDQYGVVRFYPYCPPIVDGGDYQIEGSALIGGGILTAPSFIDGTQTLQVTYTGGFVERTANPGAANRLPAYMEADLAWCAYRLLRPSVTAQATQLPAGAGSVSLGDAAVGFAGAGPKAGSSAATAGIWSRETLRWGRAGRRV